MRVQSIWTAIEVRDVTRDHLFVAAGEMSFGKVNGVGKLHYLPQKIWTLSKAFKDAGHFCAAGSFAPHFVGRRGLPGSVCILDLFDL